MQTINSSSVHYAPNSVPDISDLKLKAFLTIELRNLQIAINLLAAGHLDTSYAAPTKLREGDIRLADGTSWNPGSGKGVYCYYSSAWHLLG